MALNKQHLKDYIQYLLQQFRMDSNSAINLLLGTAAQESSFGTYLTQINGPALGIFQMEPNTHDDIWSNYLAYRNDLSRKILDYCRVSNPSPFHIVSSLDYAIIMARVHYRRVKEPLPMVDDIPGHAQYWKRYYNTYKGKGTVEEFMNNYERYVL